MVCLSRNAAIKHLAVKNRMTLHADGVETEANVEFAEPRISTYINEGIAINSAVIDYMGKRALLPWTLATKTLDDFNKVRQQNGHEQTSPTP